MNRTRLPSPPVISRTRVYDGGGDEVTICIRQHPHGTYEADYEVFVQGGLLADGSESEFCVTLPQALALVASEATFNQQR